MTPLKAIADAQKGTLLPVYVVVGEERYLVDQVVVALRTASLGGGVAAFNEDRFTAGEVDVERVISAARTVPMMARRRFVAVRGIERWDSAAGDADGEGRGKKEASPLDRLAEFAQAPIDSACVVLYGGKLDGRRKLAALAKKQGFLVACEPLSRGELPSFIVERARERGNAIDKDVADFLAEIAGPELGYVTDAVERLSLFVGAGNPITEEAVSECIVRVRTADTWALVGAVGARDLHASLAALHDVYDPRDRGLPLLGAIAWSVRQLARVQAVMSGGTSADEAIRKAGIPPFRAREIAARAKQLKPRESERWLLVLAETDLALKSSRRPPDAILGDMITRLCRGR